MFNIDKKNESAKSCKYKILYKLYWFPERSEWSHRSQDIVALVSVRFKQGKKIKFTAMGTSEQFSYY